MAKYTKLGAEAIKSKGWLRAHKWLLLRRISQIGILLLFLLGPLGLTLGVDEIWILKGNLASSLLFDTVPMTDPFLLLQILAAGFIPITTVVLGAIIVTAFYLLVGGRAYCSWVCPVNIVTDTANWLREKLGIKTSTRFTRNTRYWMLGMVLVLSAVTGNMAYELLNPVSMVHRGIIFGVGIAWTVVIGIFLFDLFVAKRGWCTHLCPMGAMYGLIGKFSPIRVRADQRSACDDCMECFAVCPEPQVIKPALKGADKGIGPVILSGECTNCGRCIDICSVEVFNFGTRFNNVDKVENVKGSAQQV
jgi:ferredoxin-type protein NapH